MKDNHSVMAGLDSLPPAFNTNHRLDLLVPHTREAMAQSQSFASISRFLWNVLSPSTRSQISAGNPFFYLAFVNTMCTGCASEQLTLVEALHKCLYTIQILNSLSQIIYK